jgi:WD40 repeat protein
MTRWNLTFTPDSATLLVGGGGGVRFFDVGTRRAAGPPLPDPAKDIGALAGSPDGRLLATGGATGTIRLWRVQQWNIARPADLRAAVCGIAHHRPIAYLALFAANGFAIGWRRAYDVSIGITSPAGSRVLVLAWFLSVAGWLLVPAVVGGIAGYVVSDAITSRRTGSAGEIFTRDDDE